MINRWAPTTSHRYKVRINYIVGYILSKLKLTIYNGDVGLTRNILDDIGYTLKLSQYSITSCISMYAVICIVSMIYYHKIKNFNSIYYASILYIDSDYTVDLSPEPQEYIDHINSIIQDDIKWYESHGEIPECDEKTDKNIRWYRLMIKDRPQAIYKVFDLFDSEIRSSVIQMKKNISREELMKITLEKSKDTAHFMCAILDIDDDDFRDTLSFIGYICQLVDDFYDMDEDKKAGIKTLFTYDMEKYGNVDQLFEEIIKCLYSLDNKYNLIRLCMLHFTLYIPTKFNVISTVLMLQIEPYILVDNRYGVSLEMLT